MGILQSMMECFDQGEGQTEDTTTIGARLDASNAGAKVVLDGNAVSGDGLVFADTPLHQDQVYFDVTVEQIPEGGSFCVGVMGKPSAGDKGVLEMQMSDVEKPATWCMCTTQSTVVLKEGDVLGCAYDQLSGKTRIDFYCNGELLPGTSISGIRGMVFPAMSTSGGVKLLANFSLEPTGFKFPPPRNFGGIIPSRNLM